MTPLIPQYCIILLLHIHLRFRFLLNPKADRCWSDNLTEAIFMASLLSFFWFCCRKSTTRSAWVLLRSRSTHPIAVCANRSGFSANWEAIWNCKSIWSFLMLTKLTKLARWRHSVGASTQEASRSAVGLRLTLAFPSSLTLWIQGPNTRTQSQSVVF